MKYPQVVSLPSAVTNWLEEQLEARGIDAVLYTRYVLSLLHTHTVDVIYSDEDLVPVKKNCEIESLVDELCEKLKDINEQQSLEDVTSLVPANQSPVKQKKVSPKEQAEKYYAAFPALCRGGTASPAKLISLIPKWYQSPKKTRNRKTVCRPAHCQLCPSNNKFEGEASTSMKSSRAASSSKQRPNYLGGKKGQLGISRTLNKSDSVTNWDGMFSGGKGLRHVSGSLEAGADQCVDEQNSWNEEDINMYDDLPVNIRELLDSPTPPQDEDSVEMMNLANAGEKLRDTMKSNFISGNIISSIWSNNEERGHSMDDVTFDNRFNAALDESASVGLDRKFRSITIEEPNTRDIWSFGQPSADDQNEKNAFFERQSFFEGFHSSLPAWSNATDNVVEDECFENVHLLNRVAVSLMKINHNKESSCFAEIVPTGKKSTNNSPVHPFNAFGFGSGVFPGSKKPNLFDKEDLLTSEKSHFKPINEKLEAARAHEYADGATFIISNNLDKVDYKRSESGSMYLETEPGQSKKYREFFLEDDRSSSSDSEFVLKFSICQNDMACQTDDNFSDSPDIFDDTLYTTTAKPSKNSDDDLGNDEDLKICTCPLIGNTNDQAMNTDYSTRNDARGCAVHPNRPESMTAEVMWKYEPKGCNKCRNNNNAPAWSANWLRAAQAGSQWDNQDLRNIWSGVEICHDCLSSTGGGGGGGRPPPDANLREDISQDGEQLLSDLSSVQKCYRDDLPVAAQFGDISNFFVPKERKRRHSYISNQPAPEPMENSRSSWSFASRLEEDCLIQMSTMPTLRSVTL